MVAARQEPPVGHRVVAGQRVAATAPTTTRPPRWIRRYDPSRPLHYEGAIRCDWTAGPDGQRPRLPDVPARSTRSSWATPRSGLQRRPLIMCEFSHAMGNSNGTPGRVLGRHRVDARACRAASSGSGGTTAWSRRCPTARRDWAYGGDFGDEPNDGNFCMRRHGLARPDAQAGDVGAQGAGGAGPHRHDARRAGPRRGHDPEPPGLDRARLAARPVRARRRRRRGPRRATWPSPTSGPATARCGRDPGLGRARSPTAGEQSG